MNRNTFLVRAVSMYVDGFRGMTVGKRLWVIILVKLAILFLVFRLFFFPDFCKKIMITMPTGPMPCAAPLPMAWVKRGLKLITNS